MTGGAGGAYTHRRPLSRSRHVGARPCRNPRGTSAAPEAVPGILGVIDGRMPFGVLVRLARTLAERVRVQPGLRIDLELAPEPPAVLGRVDLGVFDARPAPLRSADGTCRLVLHGEIVGADADAVLARYVERGEAALSGLSGSFALALWDGRARRLFLVNDRFGLRNVYYVGDADRLFFAPQVSALPAEPVLDAQAAAEFLTFQCVLGDRTLVDGVRLLPPATLLVFEPGRGVRLEPTWRFRYRPRPADDHPRALAEALRAAASRFADRPRVALPLSGGLDSRTLLAAIDRRPLPTITYGRPASDDVRLGAELAALAGTEHHALPLALGYIAAEARTMVERTDGMHSCLNAHASVLRRAAEVADVLLLGNGGDCLLDGLWTGRADAADDELGTRLLAKLTLGLPAHLVDQVVAPGAPFADARRRARASLARLLAASDGDSAHDRADAFNVVHRHRRWVLQGVPAQSTHLEFRHPYYDDAVIEAALGVPAELRAERRAHVAALTLLAPALAAVRRQGKPFGFTVPPWRWQVHVAGGRLRDAVRWRANRLGLNPFLARPRRGGFADYDEELRHGSRSLLDDVLVAPETLDRGWWRPDGLRRLVAEHLGGRANHAGALGVVLTLELYARQASSAAARTTALQKSA